MKNYKIISFALSLILMFSFLCVTPVFAQSNDVISAVSAEDQNHMHVECDCSSEDYSNGFVTTTISVSEILSRLISQEPFTIDGTITKDDGVVTLEEFYDFSTMSRFDIAEWAYKNELISEAQMIESYCDLLITRNFENIICLDPIYNTIDEYSSNNIIGNTLDEKINLALENTEISISQITMARDSFSVSDGQIIVDACNNDVPYAELERIFTMAQAIKNSYINLGIPFMNSSYDDYYIISVDTSPSTSTCHTIALDGSIIGDQYLSVTTLYVTLDDDGEISESDATIRQLLAHGMFHAIQNSYYSGESWFKEACADWGAWATTGLTAGINFNAFINSRRSMSENVGNGAMLFPATIARYYGGAATIEEIYYQLYVNVRGQNETEKTFLKNAINGALVERGYGNVDFNEIFFQMSAFLAEPAIYGFIAPGMYNTFNGGNIVYSAGDDFQEDDIRGLDRAYFSFTPDEDLLDYEIEFEVGVFGDNVDIHQYWYNDVGELIISHLILNSDGIVRFSQPDYDEGNPSGFVGIVIACADMNNDVSNSFYINYTVTEN